MRTMMGLRWLLGGAALLWTGACMGGAGKPIPLNPVRFLSVERRLRRRHHGRRQRRTGPRRHGPPPTGRPGPVLFVLAGDVLAPASSASTTRPPDGRGAQRGPPRLRHVRQPRVRAAARHARRADRRIQVQVALEQLHAGDGTPFPEGPALGHGPGLGPEGGLFGLTLRGPTGRQYRCTSPTAPRNGAWTLSSRRAPSSSSG